MPRQIPLCPTVDELQKIPAMRLEALEIVLRDILAHAQKPHLGGPFVLPAFAAEHQQLTEMVLAEPYFVDRVWLARQLQMGV